MSLCKRNRRLIDESRLCPSGMAGGLLSPEWPAFLSLLVAAFLPFWPMIHMRFDNAHHPIWSKIDHYLPWFPGILVGLALVFDIIAHLSLDTDHQRVAMRLTEEYSLISRLAVAMTGWTTWALLVMLGLGLHLAVTTSVLDEGGDIAGDSHRMHDGVLIWFGVFWCLMMFALLPSDPFPETGNLVIPAEVPAPPSMWNVLIMAPTLLLGGWLIGFGILHLTDVTCPARWPDTISRPHPGTGWFVAMPISAILLGLTMDDLNTVSDGMALSDLVLDSAHGRRTAFMLAFCGTLILSSCSLHAAAVSAHRTRIGSDRWKGLAATIGHTLFLLLVGGWCLLAGLPGVDASWGATALLAKLAMPLILLGAVGMLLPLVGFDDRPRAELWGWTVMLMAGTPALALWEPRSALLALTLLPALSFAAIIPPMFEKDVRLSKKRKKNWVITILLTDLTLILLLFLFAFDIIGLIAILPVLFISTLIPGILVHAWPEHID